MKQVVVPVARFIAGLGLFLFIGSFIVVIRFLFWALGTPCLACADLTTWLTQTLSLLAPALVSLAGGMFLKKETMLRESGKWEGVSLALVRPIAKESRGIGGVVSSCLPAGD